jgi:hypothetical protein
MGVIAKLYQRWFEPFTEVMDTPFEGRFEQFCRAFEDVDGNGEHGRVDYEGAQASFLYF